MQGFALPVIPSVVEESLQCETSFRHHHSSFFFLLSSFFFARLRLACVNGDGPFLHFILLRQVREHCINFYSHITHERTREGTETLPYTIRAKRNKSECVAQSH